MQTENILALLVAERDKLNRAIEALQGPTKRQVRAPKRPVAAAADYNDPSMPDSFKPKAFRQEAPTPTAKRKPRTAAQRKAHGLRMKAYWAAKRKAEVKSQAKPKVVPAKRKAEAKPTAIPEPTKTKRTFTAAQRKQQGERMKAFWAAKRKAQAKSEAKPKPKAVPAEKAVKAE
jgi:hypothetical protein